MSQDSARTRRRVSVSSEKRPRATRARRTRKSIEQRALRCDRLDLGCWRVMARRFPPPWSVEETPACFIVRDHDGQQLVVKDGAKSWRMSISRMSRASSTRRRRAEHACRWRCNWGSILRGSGVSTGSGDGTDSGARTSRHRYWARPSAR